jgi:hypothetical protein
MQLLIKNGLLASLSVEETFQVGEQNINVWSLVSETLSYSDYNSPHLLQRHME